MSELDPDVVMGDTRDHFDLVDEGVEQDPDCDHYGVECEGGCYCHCGDCSTNEDDEEVDAQANNFDAHGVNGYEL
jgi:hypothetical protein